MKEFLQNTFKGDKILWVVFVLFLCVSALEMYSASSSLAYKQSSYIMPVWSHITFLCMGFFVAFFVHLLPRRTTMFFPVFYFISLGLLLWALVSGVSVNEAARWTSVMGIRFQPSELGKLAMVTNLALVLKFYNQGAFFSKKAYFWICLGVAGLICLLILPENFSTAFLCGCTALSMMFYARMPIRWMAMLVGVFMGVLVLFYFVSPLLPENRLTHRSSLWVHRIDKYISGNEEVEENRFVINDENYQVAHAKIAISNSKYVGKGIGNSIERDFLPQAYSDFIFAIIIEETGLLGAFVVILLYLIVMYRAAVIAKASESIFEAVLVMGLSTMIVYQAFINMAVAVGFFPVTGQPLPLISRGGTSIVIISSYFGLMLWVSRLNLSASHEIKKEKR